MWNFGPVNPFNPTRSQGLWRWSRAGSCLQGGMGKSCIQEGIFFGTVETLKDPTSEGVPSHGLDHVEGLIPAGFLDISENGGVFPPKSAIKQIGWKPLFSPFILGAHPYFWEHPNSTWYEFHASNSMGSFFEEFPENYPNANLWSLVMTHDPCEGNKFLDLFWKITSNCGGWF